MPDKLVHLAIISQAFDTILWQQLAKAKLADSDPRCAAHLRFNGGFCFRVVECTLP